MQMPRGVLWKLFQKITNFLAVAAISGLEPMLKLSTKVASASFLLMCSLWLVGQTLKAAYRHAQKIEVNLGITVMAH
jgi:hypothetical protein